MTKLRRILLAEDNENDLELTLTALREKRVANEIVVVRDGAQAWEYLCAQGPYTGRSEGNPAVVLLDLKLPKVDGLEVLKAVRETAELRSLPIVMLTSSHEEGDVVKSYELGVNAYVVKPVEFKAFVSAIADLGVFWAVLNEPPPGSAKAARRME